MGERGGGGCGVDPTAQKQNQQNGGGHWGVKQQGWLSPNGGMKLRVRSVSAAAQSLLEPLGSTDHQLNPEGNFDADF